MICAHFVPPLRGIQGQSVRMNVALPLCNPALLEMTPALPCRERDQLPIRKRVVDRHARQLTPHRRQCSAITTTDARIRACDLASQIRRMRNPRNWHTVIACRSAFESSRSQCWVGCIMSTAWNQSHNSVYGTRCGFLAEHSQGRHSLAATLPRVARPFADPCELVNQIEIYFSIVQRKVLTPNDFPTLAALEHHLLGFQHQTMAKPFRWTFTRAKLHQLLAKLATAPNDARPAA
jgi:hypothetical protein